MSKNTRLINTIEDLLHQQGQHVDEKTTDALSNARRQALSHFNQSQANHSLWSWRTAATIATVLVVVFSWQPVTQTMLGSQQGQYEEETIEFYKNLDFYQWLDRHGY